VVAVHLVDEARAKNRAHGYSVRPRKDRPAPGRGQKLHGEKIHALRDAQDQLCPLIHIFQLACY